MQLIKVELVVTERMSPDDQHMHLSRLLEALEFLKMAANAELATRYLMIEFNSFK